jgi:hypothetical protein
MKALIYKNFIYIPIYKNGSSTFRDFLVRHGWEQVQLLDFKNDLGQYKLWGHITDPVVRHTKGIVEFLTSSNRVDLLDDPLFQKLCALTILDHHTWSIWIMTKDIAQYPIHWIPLDAKITKWNQYPVPTEILNGNDLTNDFFRENNLDLVITDLDNVNQKSRRDEIVRLREIVDQIKSKHPEDNLRCMKNFLEPDLILYNNTLSYYRDKYLNATTL